MNWTEKSSTGAYGVRVEPCHRSLPSRLKKIQGKKKRDIVAKEKDQKERKEAALAAAQATGSSAIPKEAPSIFNQQQEDESLIIF
jgi:hypothetical protein